MFELISPFQSELDALTSNQTRSSVTPPPETSHQPSANTLVQLVEERLSMYEQALQTAKQAGDGSKARRMDRGLKVS